MSTTHGYQRTALEHRQAEAARHAMTRSTAHPSRHRTTFIDLPRSARARTLPTVTTPTSRRSGRDVRADRCVAFGDIEEAARCSQRVGPPPRNSQAGSRQRREAAGPPCPFAWALCPCCLGAKLPARRKCERPPPHRRRVTSRHVARGPAPRPRPDEHVREWGCPTPSLLRVRARAREDELGLSHAAPPEQAPTSSNPARGWE